MTLKPCVQCGEPSDQSRCPAHRPRCTKPSSRTRGYDTAWTNLSRRARRLQPWCSDCGATEDLQADHTPEAWAAHDAGKPIKLTMIDVVCGPCNRRRGAARGDTPNPTRQHPAGKAEFGLLIGGSDDPAEPFQGVRDCEVGFPGAGSDQESGDTSHGGEKGAQLDDGVARLVVSHRLFEKCLQIVASRFRRTGHSGGEIAQRLSVMFVVFGCPSFMRHHVVMVA